MQISDFSLLPPQAVPLPRLREAKSFYKKEGTPIKTYNKANIPLAKNLRKNMTPWERKLWYEFLNKYPLRFQRQKAIGDYIVDFYCAKAKLIIELDGGGHFNDKAENDDTIRTEKLQSLGFTVIHIANNDIDRNFTGVCKFIDEAVKALIPT